MAMYGDSSGTTGMEAKSDHTKVSAKKKSMRRECLLQTTLLQLFHLSFSLI